MDPNLEAEDSAAVVDQDVFQSPDASSFRSPNQMNDHEEDIASGLNSPTHMKHEQVSILEQTEEKLPHNMSQEQDMVGAKNNPMKHWTLIHDSNASESFWTTNKHKIAKIYYKINRLISLIVLKIYNLN